MSDEIWKPYIKNPAYIVSNLGNVRLSSGEESQPMWPDKKGYLCVDFTLTVHRMVALTFIENPLNLRTVNHKNGIKTDNRVCNLEWMTNKENVLHSRRVLGLNVGSSHPRASIDELTALTILTCLSHSGMKLVSISKSLNVSYTVVSQISQGRSWHHVRQKAGHV